LDCAGYGGCDGCAGGGSKGAVASVGWLVCGFEAGGEGLVDRIHWGSSVTISPGVTIPFPPNRARFAARISEAMSTSPS